MATELLAPGGSFEALKAAVSSGADAIYVGASKFSARQNAVNFDKDELKNAVSYCHIRGVKVYLAINTMIYDREVNEALKVSKEAYESGVDGYIVQDLGLSSLISEKFDIPVHASTQMTVFDENGLEFLKERGIKRAVLARECRKAEIARLAKLKDMELEVFCHGAICMSYSGQCLMSSMLGGRSANRGACAQPCRLPYSISDKTGYFLSPKDLSLLKEIPDLINMGISSLKIEGRMKGPSYVASAVTAFRKVIDNGFCDEEDEKRLLKAFSRGDSFTIGCYGGATGKEIMNVTSSNDDVLKKGETLEKELKYLWEEGKEIKKIPVDIKLSVYDDNTKLEISDGINCVEEIIETCKNSQGQPLSLDYAKTQLTKLGNTPYIARDFKGVILVVAYFKTAQLNELRREAFSKLSLKREGNRKYEGNIDTEEFEKIKNDDFELLVSVQNLDQAKALLDCGCENLFVPYKLTGKVKAKGVYIPAVYGKLPDEIEEDCVLAGSLGAFHYASKKGKKVIADYSMNVANRFSGKVFDSVTVSPEMTLSQIKEMGKYIPLYALGYGYLPLMTSRNCIIKGSGLCNGKNCENCSREIKLKDRKSVLFTVTSDEEFNILYNSVPIFMGDKLKELKESNIKGLRLMFTKENPDECVKIYKMYKGEEKAAAPRNYTRGYFFKDNRK